VLASGDEEEEDASAAVPILNNGDISLLVNRLRAQNGGGVLAGSVCAAQLGDIPSSIKDVFSAVLGDAFHFMDRPKVPMHHEYKKPYFFALQEAWFAWEPSRLEKVKASLRTSGLTEEEVEAKMYYDISFFRKRVPRIVLPPSNHYPRVRAVFELFGPKVDSKSGAALFNPAAWGRARNVLAEILAGNAADPPGVSFYTQQTDAIGEPVVDSLGNPLIDCSRGSNRTENVHKHLVATFGGWTAGIEMSDMLLAERRHRYNQSVSEQRRPGFPVLGMCDTWLVDSVQLQVEANHGVLLYPGWSNPSDFVATTETFGTACLHSDELAAAIAAIDLRSPAKQMTRELQYLCKAMQTKLPLLPVHGEDENKLFSRLVLSQQTSKIDFDAIALDWCKLVDGVTVFPKLPVYLSMHHTAWSRNQRVRDAVRAVAQGVAALAALNTRTAPSLNLDRSPQAAAPAVAPAIASISASAAAASQIRNPAAIASSPTPACAPTPFPDVMPPTCHHAPMPPPPSSAMRPSHPRPAVGGMNIGPQPQTNGPPQRRHGQRGGDEHKRQPRSCQRCLANGGQNAQRCKGRAPRVGRAGCEYFSSEPAQPAAPSSAAPAAS
jgi:hypothetical protein